MHAWLDEAARDAPLGPSRPLRCSADRVVIRLEPEGAAPLDVEITREPARSFRRAGGFGVSPLLEVDDFERVPIARRGPFERLVRWMDAHEDRVALGGNAVTPRLRVPIEELGVARHGPVLLVAALALAMLLSARRSIARARSVDRRAAFAIFAVALGLRLALGAWGPLHVNGQGALWVLAASGSPAEADAYGPGYAELFSSFTRLSWLAPDLGIFAVNAALSALVPVLLFGVARRAGVDRPRAMVAASILALDPVSIRIAATESYVPPIAALTMLGALFTLIASSEERGRLRAIGWAIAAGLVGAQAARVHPVAWIPVALLPTVAAASPRRGRRSRLLLAVAATCVVGATVLATSARELLHAYESMRLGDMMTRPWAWPDASAMVALASVFAILALVARPRPLFAFGAASALALACTRHNYGQSALWQATFDRLYLAPIVAALVTPIPVSAARARAFGPAVAALLGAVLVVSYPGVLASRTPDDAEYRWARRALTAIPPACRVIYVGVAGRRTMFLPTFATPARVLRLDARAPIDLALTLGPPGCDLYVRTSLCASAEGRPVCDDVERSLELEVVERASFAAAPSYDGLPYDSDVVEASIARILRRRWTPVED